MSVKAKFVCESVTKRRDGAEVKLKPVAHGNAENEAFFKWTPYGDIELGLVSFATAEQFVPGKEYYVTFDAVPEAVAPVPNEVYVNGSIKHNVA